MENPLRDLYEALLAEAAQDEEIRLDEESTMLGPGDEEASVTISVRGERGRILLDAGANQWRILSSGFSSETPLSVTDDGYVTTYGGVKKSQKTPKSAKRAAEMILHETKTFLRQISGEEE